MLLGLLAMAVSVAAYSINGFVPNFDKNWLSAVYLRLENVDTHTIDTQYLTAKGNFSFPGIDKGVYVLSVDSPIVAFEYRYKLSLSEEGLVVNKVLYGHSLSDVGPSEAYPIELNGYKRLKPITKRPAFSFWLLIKQPMVFMGIVTMLLMFGMPYLMDMLDEDTLAEIQKVNAARLGDGGQSSFAIAKDLADNLTKSSEAEAED